MKAPEYRPVREWIERITQPLPRLRTFLRAALLVSLAFHAAIAWPLKETATGGLPPEQLKALETEYGKKVAAARRAGQVARELAGKITMPPPPPDPEGVVSSTLNQALTGDIEKVVGKLLGVEVTRKLTDQVAASLKDELAEAAKDIAAGNLSEEEIRALHERFKKKAHETAVAALKDYRVETQVERATMSTTEWYENNVSRTLFGNIHYELFRREHGRMRWHEMWSGQYSGWTRFLEWSNAKSLGFLKEKLAQLEKLSRADAATALAALHEGTIQKNGTYPTPSWRSCVHGGIDTHEHETSTWQTRMSEGLLREFYPHREEEMKAAAEACDRLWEKALAAGDDPAAVRELRGAIAALIKPADESLQALNWAVRVDVLTGPRLEEMYALFGDELTQGLQPLVRTFARGQFKKGIIANKDGVDAAMREFAKQIVPLLRRDIERMIPRKVFARLVFDASYPFKQYRTPGIGEATRVPSEEDAKAEREFIRRSASRNPELKAYAEKRRAHHEENFRNAVMDVTEEILNAVLTGGLLLRDLGRLVEGVDYADKVQEKLDARQAALAGRGQDLARLTADGVPDTSAPLVALLYGASKGHGANLEPVTTTLQPAFVTRGHPAAVLRHQVPKLPPRPAKVGFEEQAEIKPPFKSARVEAIPFLPRFPRLDGDLSDWGKVRPLVMQAPRGPSTSLGASQEPVLVYAAWNYQGFFFGYRVKQAAEKYYYPSQWGQQFNHNTGDVGYVKTEGVEWAWRGDSLRLCFDTLDARNQNRGEPHSQEFVVFPRGTDGDPQVPGVERLFESQRDAKSKEYRGVKAACKVYLQQPPPEQGPDGTGPYRVTKFEEDGYSVEAFVPRSLFSVPVFAPGWWIGFDCWVAQGYQQVDQGRARLVGQSWASSARDAEQLGLNPSLWGDLLLLGTDPRIVVQAADAEGSVVEGILPGHSYLLSVIDPDRNVSAGTEDTVIVSAEVKGGRSDVEVFVLKETGKNTGVFRGYIDTQPGAGREVQGALEAMPGHEVRFGYVDFADAKGARGVVSELKLPVVSSLMGMAPKER